MKTKINWYDLPERTVIGLDEETQSKLLSKAISKFGKKKYLAEALGINPLHLRNYLTRKSNFTVKTLKRLTKLLLLPEVSLNKSIIEVGRLNPIKHPKLPFNLHTEEGVILRSIVNSEGHIRMQVGTSMQIRVPEEAILKTAIGCCRNIFGDFRIQIKKTKDKNTKEIFLPNVIAECLLLSGVTKGRKSKVNPSVPNDILKRDKNLKRAYLQWSFISEMEANRNVKLTRSVNITNLLPTEFIENLSSGATFKHQIPEDILRRITRKPNLLLGEIKLLKDFGIIKSPRLKNLWKAKNGQVSAEWSIWLTNKREFEILLYEIGIPLKEKFDKIKSILDSYRNN